MSSAELVPLFPSATHPAIPIAARILSTLRSLTAPGKGNDMKPEERAALVGISALLGCEKIQSKDLPESSAQKASSVSPAHFRSALSRSRRLLSQVQPDTSPSKGSSSSSRRSSPRKPTELTAAPAAHTAPGPSVDPLSPFQTPKKKYKFSSGIDVSDLLRSGSSSRAAHTPSQSSPLRHSTTPGAGRVEGGVEGKDGGVEKTPTKRTKFHSKGVDLSAVDVELEPEPQLGSRSKRRKVGGDMSAFMALRPGSSPATVRNGTEQERGDEMPQEEREYLLSRRQKRSVKKVGGKGRRQLVRRDWTCREAVWGSEEVNRRNREVIDQVVARLPAYLEAHGQTPSTDLTDPAELVQLLIA